MKLELFSAWSTQRPKENYVQYHSHNYYELVFYCSGNGITHIDTKSYCFASDNFALIPPHVDHDEIHYESGKVICICFSCDEELEQGFYNDRDGEFKIIIFDMLSESLDQPYGYGEMLTALLTILVMKVLRNKQNTSSGRKNDFRFVINYISDYYHEKISLRMLAEQLNLSYDYFRHQFKEQTGYSPQQFLLMKRLSAAKKLLSSGRLSCTEIAYQCGFSNSAQFSSIFKREFGMTPLEYRKGMGEELQIVKRVDETSK